MKRLHLLFRNDLLAFGAFSGLLATGYVIKFILPPGSGTSRGFKGGRGLGHEVVTQLWGWTRHEWSDVHFIFAVTFSLLLVIHLFLHWSWIKGYFQHAVREGRDSSGSLRRQE